MAPISIILFTFKNCNSMKRLYFCKVRTLLSKSVLSLCLLMMVALTAKAQDATTSGRCPPSTRCSSPATPTTGLSSPRAPASISPTRPTWAPITARKMPTPTSTTSRNTSSSSTSTAVSRRRMQAFGLANTMSRGINFVLSAPSPPGRTSCASTPTVSGFGPVAPPLPSTT